MKLGRAAYRVEADLIGFDGIPPLHETAEQVCASSETFWGCRLEGRLAGVIAFERIEQPEAEVEISRLIVHPDFFRRGIGSRLLEVVLARHPEAVRFTVSTGEKNIPAVSLYERYGFQTDGRREVAPGVWIMIMSRNP